LPKDAIITAVTAEETATVVGIESEKKRTVPPPRYSEATLLSAMEGAGKFVEDEELREAMRERGIGTPATRAAIIEGLVRERYLIRDGRELVPTPKAQSLLRLLRALKVEDLTLPAMTGDWEYKLRRMERADFDHEQFMKEIRKLTTRIVDAAKACGEVEKLAGDYATLQSPCPSCGGTVRESHRRFSCQSCEFFLWKAVAGREFSVAEVEELLSKRETVELEGFRSKMGREFSAPMFLRKDDDGNWKAIFDFDNNGGKELTAADLQDKETVGACPKCTASVRDVGVYVCKRKVDDGTCDFSFPRRILQRELLPAEMQKLLADGQTDFLDGFISKKNRRPFKARLKINKEDKSGALTFDFPPRAAKKTAAKK
jgi:DNA topoisomerase-3